ncbi:MAG: YkgJ family cysteine cluster protein [Bacteroidales bacterium]|jgi:Fe-S-cluster containining protein|nr:YkgJ family cysteine cluster protein [Bacteroidales bacterium]HOL97774.1 YkgJ family cysteine cluster protein [Bacteroidales bacterium]HOM35823.1 YkgJ family cysteine cluster protein [Bacteroidales bacterium]HPD23257.1 YkgJ family cysteine cluster protein [Bacteroidales bacterium]HRS99261.1 YkgJ family cysteine cluster protein [Bacteroidales bacterium]
MPDYKNLLNKLRQINSSKLDSLFGSLHEKFFCDFDCLTCANCCKHLGPRFNTHDIDKISHLLKIRSSDFIEKYLKIDEDGDYVFKNMPCPFLGEDNYCSVYDVRPKACKDYPHTNRKNIRGILELCNKNIKFCPAVEYVFKNLEIMRQQRKL